MVPHTAGERLGPTRSLDQKPIWRQPEKIPVILSQLRRRVRRARAFVRELGLVFMTCLAGAGVPGRVVAQAPVVLPPSGRDTMIRNAPPLVLGALFQQLATTSPRAAAAQALARGKSVV